MSGILSLEEFPTVYVIHTVKGFGIVNTAEANVFLELSFFFNDPTDAGNLISGSSAFSKTSLNNWKFTVRELKSWLKTQHSENEDHSIWSHHFMGNRWGNSVRLYFSGLKITADGDCSHEIKRRLLLGRKVMTNLDSMFKSREITLPTKVCLVKAMVFPVVMYGCESWTMKKAER